MAHSSSDYMPRERSLRYSSPAPGPAARNNRPTVPRNAVEIRAHPPLYAGDYNNNLSRDMYWWEKLDKDDPEEKRVLEAMYYGEERQPRCNACERQNRACMWHLGEEDQSNKSCVKCRRVHATCKTIGSLDTSVDDMEDQSCIEVQRSTYVRPISLHKRKASEFNEGDKIETRAKRTRSSLRAKSTREIVDQESNSDMAEERSRDKQYVGSFRSDRKNEFDTPLQIESSWVDSDLKLDEETEANAHTGQPSVTEHSDGRSFSMTVGRDEHASQAMAHGPDQYRPYNASPGLNQIEKGFSALFDERCSKEIQNLRTTHRTEMTALWASFKELAQNRGGRGFEDQVMEMETQIETERVNRRRLEDENMRLKNRISRVDGKQVEGMKALQDRIRKLQEDLNID